MPQERVKVMGGIISHEKDKSKLIFKCLLQFVTLALLQIAVSIACLLAMVGLISEVGMIVMERPILPPSLIKSILAYGK